MRVVFFSLLMVSALFAVDISARYKVSFGVFGQIGIAKTNLHVDENNHYKIDVHVQTTGFANFLSGNREEWYTSQGTVDVQGIFLPDIYEKIVKRTVSDASAKKSQQTIKKDTKKYVFLHAKKEIRLEQTKQRNEKIDIEVKKGDYYARNDLLSLFFNFRNLLPSLEVTEPRVFYAVGADKKDGHLDINPIQNPKEIKEEFGWNSGHMMLVLINQDIFSSTKGELLINLGDDGLCKRAILKDVILFGDIRGELIE